MSHYLITTYDQRQFLAPDCPNPITALAQSGMPPVCDIDCIDEWQSDCTWLTVYYGEQKPVVVPDPEPIIITVVGGLVDSVVSRRPIPNDIMVIDYDTEGVDRDNLSPSPYGSQDVFLYGVNCRQADGILASYIDKQTNRKK